MRKRPLIGGVFPSTTLVFGILKTEESWSLCLGRRLIWLWPIPRPLIDDAPTEVNAE